MGFSQKVLCLMGRPRAPQRLLNIGLRLVEFSLVCFRWAFNFVNAHIQVVNPILFVDVHQAFVGMLLDNLLKCLRSSSRMGLDLWMMYP